MKFTEDQLATFWPTFDVLWREELSLDPSIAWMTWQEREPYRIIAEKTYNRLMDSKAIKQMWDNAYDDGYDQGCDDMEE